LYELATEGVGVVAIKATEGEAAISSYLGSGDIVDLLTGGSENLPEPMDITALNIAVNDNDIIHYRQIIFIIMAV
jgi:hypothetical protein